MSWLNPLRYLVRLPAVGKRLAFWVKTCAFEALDLRVPLGNDYACPIDHYEAFYSFSEVFVQGAYAQLTDYIPLPRRWIDFGSHRGYTSLYWCWHWKRKGTLEGVQACLIDADPRALGWTQKLAEANFLLPHLRFVHGAVAPAQLGDYVPFALCEGMLSSLMGQWAPVQQWVQVPRLEAEKVQKAFPGPYDLIKIDIEGAESFFWDTFDPLVRQAQALLVEWHDVRAGYAPEGELVLRCRGLGFKNFAQLQGPVCYPQQGVYSGTVLLWR
jgi:hypothetical protein